MRLPYPCELKNIVYYDKKSAEWRLPDNATESQKQIFEDYKEFLKVGSEVTNDKDGNPLFIRAY